MLENVVRDKYERPILSLRITLTNRCNVNCLYCHHDGMVKSKDEMTADELYTICKIAKKIGVRKIRLSGGEPLLKKDIIEIVERIASLDFKDISMTTNGILLGKYAQDLKDAGLDRVNVSLDTLNRETFEFITKKDYLEDAKNGILKAVEVGLYPVKINMVIMKDINQNRLKTCSNSARNMALCFSSSNSSKVKAAMTKSSVKITIISSMTLKVSWLIWLMMCVNVNLCRVVKNIT